MYQDTSQINFSTDNCEKHDSFGIQSGLSPSNILCRVNADFSATSDNNYAASYTIAPTITNNDKQYYSTTSLESTSHTSQFIGYNANDHIPTSNPSIFPPLIRPPINSPSMTHASSPQIQTVEFPGFKIIIIPKLTGLDMQHQLQQGNTCLDYPQLNQEQNYSFAINGYESTPSPMTGLTSLDVQHQLQQDDTYFHNSSYSVNPPRFNQEQNYSFTTNGNESTPSSLTGLTSLDVQHNLRQGNTCLDDSYSVNQPQLSQEQHYFSDARFR